MASEEAQPDVQVVAKTEDGQLQIVFNALLSDSILNLKEQISSQADVSTADIQLSFSGESLSDDGIVAELGVSPGAVCDLVMVLPLPQPGVDQGQEHGDLSAIGGPFSGIGSDIGAERSSEEGVEVLAHQQEYCMPTAFTVLCSAESKEVLVMVEKAQGQKPFLGGYKHKTNQVEYHNASTQTARTSRRGGLGTDRAQRETQTVVSKNFLHQTHCDASTQMSKTGCFVSHLSDKVLYSGQYQNAEDYHRRRLLAVVVLQKHLRRMLAQRCVAALKKEKREHNRWLAEEEAARQCQRKERIQREFDRRLNPKTKEDFETLYHALEMWRLDELEKINETTSGPERKAALCGLLEQEARLVASIGRHKILASQEAKVASTKKLLDDMSAPRRWMAYDGLMTEMNTQYSLRAQQLKDLYLSLTSSELGEEERRDVLMSVRATVCEHDCKLTRDIVELVDREAELLDRQMGTTTMEGLRKRISTLFLQYVKTPLFNSAAAVHIKVPPDSSSLHSKIYYCRSCCSYLPSVEFHLTTNTRTPSHCRRCAQLDNQARGRQDFTIYRAMLRAIQHSEEAYRDGARVVFLLQEMDLKHLVEGIWGGQSALSAESDLFELKMVRWDSAQEWSPWNCILLTKQEVKYHQQLDSVHEAYGPVFTNKVHQRHVLARTYFSRLPHLVSQMESKVKTIPYLKGQERVVAVTTQPPSTDVASES